MLWLHGTNDVNGDILSEELKIPLRDFSQQMI